MKKKESAISALYWANTLSTVFSVLLLLFGGLLSFCFHQELMTVIVLAAGLAIDVFLTIFFVPAAHKEALTQTNREEAITKAYRGRYYQLICIFGYILLSILLVPWWTYVLDVGTCIALLPVVSGVYLLGVAALSCKKDLELTTTEQRVKRAKKDRPRRMNLLSAAIAVIAVLSMQVYRIVWLYTSVRVEWISAVTLIAFAVFYIFILIIPLFVIAKEKVNVKRRVIRLCAARNILVAIGFLILNLSASFLREEDTRTLEIDPICLIVGFIWMVLFFLIFEFAIRRINKAPK